jgi:hypothetical protein
MMSTTTEQAPVATRGWYVQVTLPDGRITRWVATYEDRTAAESAVKGAVGIDKVLGESQEAPESEARSFGLTADSIKQYAP